MTKTFPAVGDYNNVMRNKVRTPNFKMVASFPVTRLYIRFKDVPLHLLNLERAKRTDGEVDKTKPIDFLDLSHLLIYHTFTTRFPFHNASRPLTGETVYFSQTPIGLGLWEWAHFVKTCLTIRRRPENKTYSGRGKQKYYLRDRIGERLLYSRSIEDPFNEWIFNIMNSKFLNKDAVFMFLWAFLSTMIAGGLKRGTEIKLTEVDREEEINGIEENVVWIAESYFFIS